MLLINNSDILSAILPGCYFIYMGDDNKDFPVIKMLKSQPIFFKSSFICREPIVEKDTILLSKDKWEILKLVKYYKCVLIAADLKIDDYFFELLDICKELYNRRDEMLIIVTNYGNIVNGEFSFQYENFIRNHYVIEISLKEQGQILQEILKYVLYQQAIQYDMPTVKTLVNELEWEFSLKYIK